MSLFRSPAETGTAAYLVRAICLKPYGDVDLAEMLPFAERFQTVNRDSFYHVKTLVMLQLRMEHDEQALKLCEPFIRRSENPLDVVLINSVRAIALDRLGQTEEAKDALLAAESQASETWPKPQQRFEADYGDLDSFVAANAFLGEARTKLSAHNVPEESAE